MGNTQGPAYSMPPSGILVKCQLAEVIVMVFIVLGYEIQGEQSMRALAVQMSALKPPETLENTSDKGDNLCKLSQAHSNKLPASYSPPSTDIQRLMTKF